MFRRFAVIFLPVAILISIYAYLYNQEENALPEKNLVVYTYSSFASAWGAGPELERLFKAKTGTSVSFVDVGEAGVIIQRIILENENAAADVVLGLDQFNLSDPKVNELFTDLPELELNPDQSLPLEKVKSKNFIAYSWSPMTFIYRKSDKNHLPESLSDFLDPRFKGKIILLDPQTSAPGYIFFHWLVQTLGADGARTYISQIKKKIYTVAPSWSTGYGLFKKKQSQYVFSYLTSPVYHWIEEKNDDYQPVYLKDPLPYHMEYAGILKASKSQKLAASFLKFLLEPETQKIIMNRNYMLPVTAGVMGHTEFENLKTVSLHEPSQELSREEVLSVWKSIAW